MCVCSIRNDRSIFIVIITTRIRRTRIIAHDRQPIADGVIIVIVSVVVVTSVAIVVWL